MDKVKQIEEMARIICGLCTKEGCLCDGGYCNFNCNDYERAKRLYTAGYRKQSECKECGEKTSKVIVALQEKLANAKPKWISVDERLPENNGHYLCFRDGSVDVYGFALNLKKVNKYDFEGQKRSGWYSYDSEYGYFECTKITHWMPLPEAPKMKGGEG